MQECNETNRKNSDRKVFRLLVALLAVVGLTPIAIQAQTPSVVFSGFAEFVGATSSSGTNQDFNANIGRVAANQRGDVFFVNDNFSGNPDQMVMIPAGTTTQILLISSLATNSISVTTDAQGNLWTMNGNYQLIFIPVTAGVYPTGLNASSITTYCTLPAAGNNSSPCLLNLGGNSTIGYPAISDVQIDANGNIYALDFGDNQTGYNNVGRILKFNPTTMVPAVVLDNLPTAYQSGRIAVSTNGDLFEADGANVYYSASGSGTKTTLSGFSQPTGVSSDSGGNIYVTESNSYSGNGSITVLPKVAGVVTPADRYTVVYGTPTGDDATGAPDFSAGIDAFGAITWAGGGYGGDLFRTTAPTLAFGPVPIGVYVNSQTLFVSFAKAATFGSFSIVSNSGTSVPFAVTVNNCTAGNAYAAGSSCSVLVNYEATATGPQAGTLFAYDNASNLLGTAYLSGVGLAPVFNVDPGTAASIGSGWHAPSSITVDGSGNTYVADSTTGGIYKNGSSTAIVTGFSTPSSVVVDSVGNLYVADSGNNRVVEVPYSSSTYGTPVSIFTGTSGRAGLAIDALNNLYLADSGNSRVLFLGTAANLPAGSNVSTIGSGFSTPVAVATDSAGNVYISDNGTKKIYQYNFTRGTVVSIATGLTTAAGVAVDPGGNLFYVDSGTKAITRIPNRGGTVSATYASTVATIVSTPSSIAVDASGSVYVADSVDASVGKLTKTSGTGTTAAALTIFVKGQAASFVPISVSGGSGTLGYAISPTLPAGLSFASSTATISGTPTAGSPATAFTVTVTDANGTLATANFSLEVDAIAASTAIASTTLTKGQSASFIPVTATGGIGALTYAVSPTLPSGLSFASATGTVSGTPTAVSSSSSYTVTVTDANGASSSASFSLGVNASVVATTAVSSTSLTQGHAATAFVPVTGSGGTTPLSYSVSPSLPSGLSYASATGTVSGTPTAASSSTSYTVTVTDANGASATATFTLAVDSAVTASTAVASTSLTKGRAATSFVPVSGSGGTGTLTYSVSPTLPAGLSYASASGTVSGTATAVSSATSYTVTVTDADGATATASFSLTVNSTVTASTAVASSNLTQGHAATSFVPVTASGGTNPLSYSVSPSLPTGLSFASATGTGSGTPSAASSATTYTVTVTDANGATATSTFSLTVNSAVVATTAIATSGLTQGTASTAFIPVTGSGGTGTLSYAVSPTLPSGLSYAASTGTVSGTPTVASAMTTYTVTVTDTNSATTSANFSLAVNTPVTGATNFGSLAVAASTPTTMSLAFTFTAANTIGAPRVFTQGATGLDFTDAGTGTCTTNGTSRAYNPGDSCTVIVAFTPTRIGERRGAVQIVNGSGTLLAAAFVYGTGTGPQISFSPTTTSTINSTIGGPREVAVDGSGDLFIASAGNNNVREIVAVGGTVTSSSTVNIVGSGFGQPYGVAVDGAGNVFVADAGNSTIYEIVAANGAVSSSSTVIGVGSVSLASPNGVAVDHAGNVFVSAYGNNAVYEIVAVNGAVSSSSATNVVGSGFSHPQGVAVDAAGDVFVADAGHTAVKEIVAVSGAVSSSSTVTTIGSGFTYPQGPAVDSSGNVYVGDNGYVKEIIAVSGAVSSSSTVVAIGSGFSAPYGVAVDGLGNVFATDTGNNTISKIDYSDAPSLAFATTPINTTSSDSPKTVTITNRGNAALTFEVPSTGQNPSISSYFTFGASSTCPQLTTASSAATLAAQSSCTALISFSPTVTGTISGSLVFKDNSLNAGGPSYTTQSVALSGNSTTPAPVLTVAVASDTMTKGHASPYTPVTATGGTGTLTYAVSPSLSAGLSYSSTTGAVSGTPTAVHTSSSYTVTVTDSNNVSSTANFTLAVNSVVVASTAVATTALTNGRAATSFVPVTGSGGTGTLTYSVSPTLPAGLSYASSTGTVSGTPTATSSSTTYTVTVTDVNGATATSTFSLTVNSVVVASTAVASTTLTKGHAATSFVPVTGSGGTGTLTYSVSPTLPAGLSYASSTGTVSGTPSTTAAMASYTVTVTDVNGATSTSTFSLTITPVVVASVLVASTALTQSHAATAFIPVKGSGGAGTLTYSVSPTLPAGLSYDTPTGTVSGTPTATSSSTTYTVTITDSNGATAAANFSLTVNSVVVASVTVASTTLIENQAATAFVPITASGGTTPLSYSVSPALPTGLSYATSTGTVSGTPTVVSSTATYTVTVTDANGAMAAASFSLAVSVAPTITFSIANQTYGAAPFTVTATSNSSGAFTYSIVSGPATISGSTVTLTGTGTVVVQASQAANGNYTSGTQNATFTVSAAAPTITFSIANQTYGAAPFTVAATSNSPGAFTYSIVSGPATISGSTVTLTGSGTVVVQASQAANGNYTSGTQNATFTVSAAAPTITFSIANQTYGAAPFTVTATSNSSGAFTYSIVSGPATISGSTVTLTGTGTVVVQASQVANGNYTSGTQNATFTVSTGATIATANLGANQVTLQLNSTATGTGYFTLLSGSSAACGTAARVSAGTNSSGAAAYRFGSLPLTASTTGNYTVKNLMSSTAYTVCFTPDGTTAPVTANVTTNAGAVLTPGGWQLVGTVGFSAGQTNYESLSFAPDGTPYVAYEDLANGNKTTVMKYNGSAWVTVGSAGFSAGQTNYESLSFAPNGTPYVAYQDVSNSNKATVMTFNGTAWVTVGSAGVSAGAVDYTSLSFGPDGTPYLGYRDSANSFKATVIQYNGTSWVSVGTAGFSTGAAAHVSLANGPDGSLYILFEDGASSNGATVMHYNGTSWVVVGTAAFSAGSTNYESLAFGLDGTPYVAYADGANSSKATVMHYNGTSWIAVGTAGFSPSATYAESLSFGPDGTPYLGYEDGSNGYKATVMEYNGSSWVVAGTAAFSAAGAYSESLSFGPDGTPYVAYEDNGYSQKATVMKLVVAPATPAINFSIPNQTYGASPFTVAATSNSTGAFTYSIVSGPATISGSTVTLTGTGTVVAQASQAANGNYGANTQNASFTVSAAAPTITFSITNKTYGAAPFTVTATSNSSGAFTYSIVSGPATISGSTVTLTGTGTVVVQASQAANGNYTSGTQNASFTVSAAAPTITFSIANQTYGAAPFTVAATSNSSGAFTYSIVSGPATISGSTVTLTGTGTVVVQASQAANGNYTSGTQNATFTVSAAAPTITFSIANKTYGAAPFTVAATSNSSGAFTYSIVSGPATISGSTVTLTGTGTVVVQAAQAANGNYTAGTQNASFTVSAAAPTISFTIANKTYGAAPFTVAATSNSSGAFTYSIVSGPATISGSTVTLTGTGTVVVQASQAANGNYTAGTQNATFTVAPASPTITFTVANQAYVGPPVTVAATSNSAGAFTYSVISGPATISGATVTLTGTGTVVLQASQAANGNYAAKTQNASFTVLANLLLNPGFEAGLTNWTNNQFAANVSNSVVHSGSSAVELTGGQGFGGVQQSIAIAPATSYTVGGWFNVASTTAHTNIEYFFYDAAGNNISSSGTTAITNSTDWTYLTRTITAPANAVTMAINPYAGQTSGLVYTDDLSITTTAVMDSTATAVTFSSNPVNVNTATSVTATVTDSTNGGTTPTGSVYLFDTVGGSTTALNSGNAIALSGGVASFSFTPSAAGTNSISAVYSGVSNAFVSSNGTTNLTVSAIAPTITFSIANQTYGAAPFTVAATSNSSGAFTYSIVSGPATISGSTVTLTGSGTVAVQASQAANGNYAAATQNASFTVNPAVVATTAIASSSLTQGSASTAFIPVTGSGGTGTLSYSVSPSLPAGLSFTASTGTVSGTPTVASAVTTYTVTVTDANSATASANFSLTVNTAVTGATNFGSLAVAASTPTTMSLAFTFTTASTIGAPRVFTQGATGLDFTDAGTGTCTTNGTSHTYNAGDSCTVIVAFTPTRVGERRGAVQIVNGSGTLLATALVYGTGTGPQISFSPTTTSTIGSGFNKAYGVAVDGAGDVFVADYGNQAVKEIVAVNGAVSSSSTVITVGSGFSYPSGVAVDHAGDVFVADSGDNAVKEIVAVNGAVSSSSTVTNVGSGFNSPNGVAVDHAGDVFVADFNNNAVKEIVAVNGAVSSSSTVTTVGSGFSGPFGVAVDAAGNVFVGDAYDNSVKEVVAVSGAVSSSSTVMTIGGFVTVRDVAVDSSGNVFVADYGAHAMKEIVAVNGVVSSSSTVITIGSGFSGPAGVVVDSLGNVFVADYSSNTVSKIDYSDAPSLNFANTAINTTSSDSPKTVTVTNRGTAPLTFEVPGTGLNPSISSYFTLGGSSTCPQLTTSSSAATLAAQTSCTFVVSFTPTTVGPLSGSLVTTDNNLNAASPSYASQSITLTGMGVTAPSIIFNVANQTFSSAPVAVAATSNSSGAFTYSVVSGPATISGSTVTLTGAGTVVLQASQAANGNYSAGTQNASFTVSAASTLLTLQTSAASASYGQTITLTVSLSPYQAGSASTSGELVTFKDGAATLGTGALNAGVATFTTSSLGGGSHTLTAVFGGDTNFQAATSSSISETIARTAATVTIAGLPNPSIYGDSISLSILVSGAGITPGGTVTLMDGASTITNLTLGAAGTASYSTHGLAAGVHNLHAVYNGDTNYD